MLRRGESHSVRIAGEHPATPPAASASAARALLAELEEEARATPLAGFPLTLEEALQQTPAGERSLMVACYWRTWREWMLMAQARKRLGVLEQLSSHPGVDREIQDMAQSAGRELTVREQALFLSQDALRSFLPSLQVPEYQPIPVDRPLVAGYQTHYEWYAEHGQGNERLERLDGALSDMLEVICEQSAQFRQFSDEYQRAVENSRNGITRPDQLAALLESHRQGLADLLDTVIQYNGSIGAYTLTLVRDHPAPVELARMLVPARRSDELPVVRGATPERSNAGLPGNSSSPAAMSPSAVRPYYDPGDTAMEGSPQSLPANPVPSRQGQDFVPRTGGMNEGPGPVDSPLRPPPQNGGLPGSWPASPGPNEGGFRPQGSPGSGPPQSPQGTEVPGGAPPTEGTGLTPPAPQQEDRGGFAPVPQRPPEFGSPSGGGGFQLPPAGPIAPPGGGSG